MLFTMGSPMRSGGVEISMKVYSSTLREMEESTSWRSAFSRRVISAAAFCRMGVTVAMKLTVSLIADCGRYSWVTVGWFD